MWSRIDRWLDQLPLPHGMPNRPAEQLLLSTQPRSAQFGDWYHGMRHRSRQKRDIRRNQVDRTRFSRKISQREHTKSGDHALGTGDSIECKIVQ